MIEYELYHHGVKGQKWGIRRTMAQLGHKVSKAAGKAKKAAVKGIKQNIKNTKEKRYYKKLHKKKLSQMTDKELADLTNRVKKEASLKGAKYESRAQNARKFYNTVAQQPMNEFGKQFGKELAKSMFSNN